MAKDNLPDRFRERRDGDALQKSRLGLAEKLVLQNFRAADYDRDGAARCTIPASQAK